MLSSVDYTLNCSFYHSIVMYILEKTEKVGEGGSGVYIVIHGRKEFLYSWITLYLNFDYNIPSIGYARYLIMWDYSILVFSFGCKTLNNVISQIDIESSFAKIAFPVILSNS